MKKKRILVIFGRRFWLTKLQSGHIIWVILNLSLSLCQAIRKINPNIFWKFIFGQYLTSLGTREVGSQKFKIDVEAWKFFSIIFVAHLENELKIKKINFTRESHFLQFWNCDEDYQKISEIDLSGPNDRFPSKMAKNNVWPAIFGIFDQLFL